MAQLLGHAGPDDPHDASGQDRPEAAVTGLAGDVDGGTDAAVAPGPYDRIDLGVRRDAGARPGVVARHGRHAVRARPGTATGTLRSLPDDQVVAATRARALGQAAGHAGRRPVVADLDQLLAHGDDCTHLGAGAVCHR